jgi:hypothetical protein
MRPSTFKYFVATEEYKIVGTYWIAEPGDFIVIFHNKVMSFSPVQFKEMFDVCHPVIATNEAYDEPVP